MASSSNSGSSSSESHSSRSSSTGYSRSSDSDFSSSSRSSSRGLTTVMDDMAGAFEKGETVEGAGAVLSEALDQMEAEEVGQEQAASEHETASGERAATDTAGFAAEVEAMIEEASNEDEGEAAQEAEEGPESEENPSIQKDHSPALNKRHAYWYYRWLDVTKVLSTARNLGSDERLVINN